MNKIKKAKIELKNLQRKDFEKVVELSCKVYDKSLGTTYEMLNGQVSQFPEGQLIVEVDGEVVGHCATFIIKEEFALKDHTYYEITGDGFASRHDEDGDYLYGMEIAVDPNYRGLKIGQRLYDARKALCNELGLKGIIFGGRMPNFSKKQKQVKTPEESIPPIVIYKANN